MENNGGLHGFQRIPPQIQLAHGPMQQQSPATGQNECLVREQDRLMPIANVIRIMRKVLPPHAKISDDSKETIQECVSEYISFVTGEANDRCQREQRKTITAEDILWAMNKLGFDDYIEPLTIYLHRYREIDGGERGPIRGDQPPAKLSVGVNEAVLQMGQRLFGHAAVAGLVKDSSTVGPSRPVAGFEPYAQCKE
ncbi:nuclear transcription factor Y subunit B-1-like [Rutidosis leptorrhynchoides]|uniref:nuclear transcription factor Y subunit B-1-like n=1 Tax=Rutidosis leptorrhynchoides TaxID=125765 RepID=UPI003A98F9DB